MAFTKLLASVRLRDIIFKALEPWFLIQNLILTLTLTLTNTRNHTLTLTWSQSLTKGRNDASSPAKPSTDHVTT